MSLLSDAKELIKAIEDNLLSCEKASIDTTGSYIQQQFIADEMENLKYTIKVLEFGK